jgi:hypothetical protein
VLAHEQRRITTSATLSVDTGDAVQPGEPRDRSPLHDAGIQRCLNLLVAGAVLLAAPGARAAPFALDVGLGTTFPLHVGGSATLEAPHRLLVSVGAGWMPSPYADSIDYTLRTFGAYDSDVSALIRAGLKNSFVLQPSIGWRPSPRHGLEILAGYTLVTLGGSLSGRQAIETVTGRTFPNDAGAQIPLHSTLHNVHLIVDWRWLLRDHWVLRAGLELVHCVASSSGIDATSRLPRGQEAIGQINTAIDQYLDGIYTTYVYSPAATATAAYRF